MIARRIRKYAHTVLWILLFSYTSEALLSGRKSHDASQYTPGICKEDAVIPGRRARAFLSPMEIFLQKRLHIFSDFAEKLIEICHKSTIFVPNTTIIYRG